MNRSNLYGVAFVVMLCTAGSAAFAQATGVWKKNVARMIDLQQKDDEKIHHLANAKQDTTILEMMITAMKAGRLTAYHTFDNNFTTKLSLQDLNELIASRIDTVSIVDPVTGKAETKIVHMDFDYSLIHKYRILEEWVFDPHTGKTDIQITGIAPVRDIYGDDGVYRGSQAMFWVHYNDLRNILTKYEQYHPDNTLALHIWNDYFYSDIKPELLK